MYSKVKSLGTKFIFVQSLRIKTVHLSKFGYQNYIFLICLHGLMFLILANKNNHQILSHYNCNWGMRKTICESWVFATIRKNNHILYNVLLVCHGKCFHAQRTKPFLHESHLKELQALFLFLIIWHLLQQAFSQL